MSRRQAAEFLRGMVRRQKEHGNVRGQEYTLGGRECMEGSAKKLHAPGKREAAREWQDAMGETWMETNDGARRPQDVWEKAEQVASQIEGRSAGGTPRRPPSRAEILAQLRTEQEAAAKEQAAEEKKAAEAAGQETREPARAGTARSGERSPAVSQEPPVKVTAVREPEPSPSRTQPVRLPAWVGADRAADALEYQHTGGREPLAIQGPKQAASAWPWAVEQDREPVHALPTAWDRSQSAEASR